jgi:hypothetical protein
LGDGIEVEVGCNVVLGTVAGSGGKVGDDRGGATTDDDSLGGELVLWGDIEEHVFGWQTSLAGDGGRTAADFRVSAADEV